MRKTSAVRLRQGLTLTELMIALAVLSLVISQFLLAFTNQQASYHEHENAVDAQQEARTVLDLMLGDLRMAGFMVPRRAALFSLDGGAAGSDVLCLSDPTVMADAQFTASNNRFEGALLGAALGGSTSSLTLDAASMDVDGDGGVDFAVGRGLLVSDGTRSHCGVVTNIAGNVVQIDDPTPAGFVISTAEARVVPALVYRVNAGQLTRNNQVLSLSVEDLQLEWGVDEDSDGQIEVAEFPIHDLNGSTLERVRTARVYVTARVARADADFQGGFATAANRAAGAADGFRRRRLIGDATLRNMR